MLNIRLRQNLLVFCLSSSFLFYLYVLKGYSFRSALSVRLTGGDGEGLFW
jgi:hypothetical protein